MLPKNKKFDKIKNIKEGEKAYEKREIFEKRGGASPLGRFNKGFGWLSHDTILDIGQPINVIPHLLRDLKDKIRSRNESGMTVVSCHCEVPEARQHVRQYSCALSCHCEAERSEAVAIAKSLELNEITTS